MPDELDIDKMSIPEILDYVLEVVDMINKSLPRLKAKAMLNELQKRFDYLWGKKVKKGNCHNCKWFGQCKPQVLNNDCPLWESDKNEDN